MIRYKNDKPKNRDEFTVGYICAIVTMVRLEGGSTTEIREAYEAGVGTMGVPGLRSAGVEESDIEALKPLIKEVRKRRKQ